MKEMYFELGLEEWVGFRGTETGDKIFLLKGEA